MGEKKRDRVVPIFAVRVSASIGPRGLGIGLVGHLTEKRGRAGPVVVEASRCIAPAPIGSPLPEAALAAVQLAAARGERCVDVLLPAQSSSVRALRRAITGERLANAVGPLADVVVIAGESFDRLRLRHLARHEGRRARAKQLARLASGASEGRRTRSTEAWDFDSGFESDFEEEDDAWDDDPIPF